MSLEHDNHLVRARKLPRNLQAIRLHLGNRQAGQSRHLSWVGSDDDASPAPVQLTAVPSKAFKPVGIDNQRLVTAGNNCAHERRGLRVAQIPGPIAMVVRSSSVSRLIPTARQ